MRARVVGVRTLLAAGLVAVLASLALPRPASALPEPGAGAKKRGFRLFARATGALTINRVSCGLSSNGNICTDSTGSAVSGGGFWPKGSADQYVFNSGLQLAGIVGADGGPWARDTAGGFLFDPKGFTVHGEEVRPIYNASNPGDLASWPGAACVPRGDAEANLFHPLLQTDSTTGPDGAGSGVPYCRRSASQGDIWFLSWEGNTNIRVGRSHPLGIAVETRGMGWNFPSGNEDILYFVYTFYNVTSTIRSDYNSIRPQLADILYQKALDLHAGAAAGGDVLPAGGYTIDPLFAAFAADMDVSTAGANYSSVNLPFALGYVYDASFAGAQGWTFDASIFSSPFFAGAGFVGVKYLSSPSGRGEIQLFSNTVNGRPFAGAVNDPQDVVQLYRYLSGTLSVSLGDDPCNTGTPSQTHICFVNNTSPQDMRFFQSSTPLTLAPGQGGSIVVAYIFAAPVQTAGCGATCDVQPGNPLRLTNAAQLAQGANLVDSLAGFRGYHDNGDGVVQQEEFTTVDGSLLGKAKVAQGVFNGNFLLPFAPDTPDFFLIPGDNQVTVIWKPSGSETSGDPYFSLASQATLTDGGGVVSNNILYNPNYRQFDVEGYRIYRGRVDAPNEMTLLAQYDYAGTVIDDYTGTVNAAADCAPELGLTTSCAGLAPNLKNGVTLTNHISQELVGNIVQVKVGPERVILGTGLALSTVTDTAVTGRARAGNCGPKSACPALSNTGVPFVFVDRTPRNNFRYFYSVTAFDVNAIESGPSSLESPRATKLTTPVRPASNYVAEGALSAGILGRGLRVDTLPVPVPTIDPATGRFSGPFPPANGANLAFSGEFVSRVFAAPGTVTARLLSIDLGDARNTLPTTYTYLVRSSDGDTTRVTVALQQTTAGDATALSPPAAFGTADAALSATYRMPAGLVLSGQVNMSIPNYQPLSGWGRGCGDGSIALPAGSTCLYNNPRWFDGANETQANPAAGNQGNNVTDFNNAGKLTGVATIYSPHSSNSVDPDWRIIESTLGGAIRAADFKVYWGTAGKIDSIMDVTHNVAVPFDSVALGGGFGLLTVARSNAAGSPDNRPGVVTIGDFSCVEPFLSGTASGAWQGLIPCTSAAPFRVTDSVVLGPVAMHTGVSGNLATAPARPNPGFVMYLAGHLFAFEMAGNTPPASTVWSLRSYAGTIFGGTGAGGNFGNYSFLPVTRPFSAVGADLLLRYNASNFIRQARGRDLRSVHTVPDPYYVTNEYEQTTDLKVIKFVNLPDKAIIRIYSASGVLVNILENPGPTCVNGVLTANGGVAADNANGGECTWNVRNRNNQVVASGVYFYHIESNTAGGSARRVGRMTVVNFAQ